jgi:hypothetical protein
MEPIDKPLFRAGVAAYQALGVGEFFTSAQVGETRTTEVLRISRLAFSARATVTALIAACVGTIMTAVVIANADPAPSAEWVRLAGAILAAVATAVGTIMLLVRVATAKLRAQALRHRETKKDGTPKGGIARFWARLRSPETLTPYLTIAFVGNVAAIVAAFRI